MGNTNDDLTRELYARMSDAQLVSIYTKSTPSDSHKRFIEAEMSKRRLTAVPPEKRRPAPSALSRKQTTPPAPTASAPTVPQRPAPFTVKKKSSGIGCVILIILYILFHIFKDLGH